MRKNISLTKIFTFSAAHRLHSTQLSEDENKQVYAKCNNEYGHGHDYILEVTVKGEPDALSGKIIPHREFNILIHEIIDPLDHRHLDKEIPYFKEHLSTGENIIQYLWSKIEGSLSEKLLYHLKLWETNNNFFEIERKK